jgi:hypothetical protein
MYKVKIVKNSYLTEFAGLVQNHEKTIERPKQPIKTKKICKKNMFSTFIYLFIRMT